LIRLQNRYREIDEGDEDDVPTSVDAANIINQHLDIIEDRLEKMEKQEQAEAELISRARKPTKPTLTRKPTPPAGPPPPAAQAPPKRGRGRPPSKEVAERRRMEKEDINVLDPKPKRGRGRPPSKEVAERKKMEMEDINVLDPQPKRGRGRPKIIETPVEQLIRQRSEGLDTDPRIINLKRAESSPTRIIETGAEAGAPIIEGQGLKDYMDYMKGKKPTKDMNKLILLIGSQRAGNNSYKLKVEIEKLINKIKTDLEEKIRKNKSKSAKQQVKAIELEKRKLLIREAAKKQLRDEARFKTKN